VDAVIELERGRDAHAKRAWREAHESLSRADETEPLEPEDLELLATSAYMLGRDDEFARCLERAHRRYADSGEALRAVRSAFWLGFTLMLGGEIGRSTGWLGRAQRLTDREGGDCVERGYLLVPVMLHQMNAADYDAAYATAAQAAEIGHRFGDPDLVAIAVHEQGYARVRQGRIAEGLGLLDEAMVSVTAGELSPIVTGLVYCSVIEGCQEAHALQRAHEWTAALTRWCDQQPDLVSFTGRCLVHRAEIMQLHGAWTDALEEARRAGRRFEQATSWSGVALALYQQAEVLRLRGEFGPAEDAYREASRRGLEPQPGLALLRLAQGDPDIAATSIRRVLGETTERVKRARLLPADVEIMLAVGDVDAARSACRELSEISKGQESGMLGAMAAHARGAVDLAEGDAHAALTGARRAWRTWQELEVPHEAARARVLVGLACRALGDQEAAALELEAARAAFAQLGAAPDLARVDSLAGTQPPGGSGGLTARELQVLRLVAAGRTNRAIAGELVLSERTVERHVSNIFTKLRVSSRAGATAHAYEHDLV
jgi:ATP/maltotriose-dependent transcriptional regulator MalT